MTKVRLWHVSRSEAFVVISSSHKNALFPTVGEDAVTEVNGLGSSNGAGMADTNTSHTVSILIVYAFLLHEPVMSVYHRPLQMLRRR